MTLRSIPTHERTLEGGSFRLETHHSKFGFSLTKMDRERISFRG